MLRHENGIVSITGALECERERMAGMVQGSREHVMEKANGVYPVSSPRAWLDACVKCSPLLGALQLVF